MVSSGRASGPRAARDPRRRNTVSLASSNANLFACRAYSTSSSSKCRRVSPSSSLALLSANRTACRASFVDFGNRLRGRIHEQFPSERSRRARASDVRRVSPSRVRLRVLGVETHVHARNVRERLLILIKSHVVHVPIGVAADDDALRPQGMSRLIGASVHRDFGANAAVPRDVKRRGVEPLGRRAGLVRAVVEDVEGNVRPDDVRVGHGAEEIVDVEQAIRAPRALDRTSGNLARARQNAPSPSARGRGTVEVSSSIRERAGRRRGGMAPRKEGLAPRRRSAPREKGRAGSGGGRPRLRGIVGDDGGAPGGRGARGGVGLACRRARSALEGRGERGWGSRSGVGVEVRRSRCRSNPRWSGYTARRGGRRAEWATDARAANVAPLGADCTMSIVRTHASGGVSRENAGACIRCCEARVHSDRTCAVGRPTGRDAFNGTEGSRSGRSTPSDARLPDRGDARAHEASSRVAARIAPTVIPSAVG